MAGREITRVDAELRGRLDQLEEKVDKGFACVADLVAEVGEVPDKDHRGSRKTIRERLHGLEAQTSPVAQRAVVRSEMRAVVKEVMRSWRAVTLYGFAVIAGISSLLRLLGLGG